LSIEASEVSKLTLDVSALNWLRIMPKIHRATPLGTGPGSSRFSSPKRTYEILYAAQTLASAVAEGILRDRFAAKAHSKRYVEVSELRNFVVTEVSTRSPLKLIDLRTSGVYRLGIPTDAVGARAHRAGQAFADQLFTKFLHIDGILYSSRLTKGECIAVFDRAVRTKLSATPAVDIERLTALPAALDELAVTLVV
jgi:hypothetical protein